MPHKESRPEAAHQTSAKKSTYQCIGDHLHAAFLAGYDTGYTDGRRNASQDMAREWLHALAVDFTRQAQDAAEPTGPHWRDAITAQAQAVDA